MVAEGSGTGRRGQRGFWALASVLLLSWIAGAAGAQKPASVVYDGDLVELNLAAIAANPARTDAVAELNQRLQAGSAALKFDGPSGYLRSLLELLNVPVDTQMAVYSKTSLQSPLISPSNHARSSSTTPLPSGGCGEA